MDKISPEHSLSRLKPQSFLILPLYFRCSKTLIPLVSLCWSYSSSSFFLLYWATQCSKCVSFTIFSTTTGTPKTKNHFYFSEYPGSKVDNATEILFCVSKSPQYILIPYSAVSWGSNPVLNQFWWSSAEFLNVRSKQKILKGKKKKVFLLVPFVIFSFITLLLKDIDPSQSSTLSFSYEVEVSTALYSVHWFLLLVKNITDDFISVIGTVVAEKGSLSLFSLIILLLLQ